jgi:ATP-dependent exoDNAse (exonuclease V) beta subunit
VQNTQSFHIYSASAGSGKTFTLVKEFLKILLSSNNPYKFQQILAVTFTNKAAGEMKERIIENLHQFSMKKSNALLQIISLEINLSEEIIFNRSSSILSAILQNYAALNITTIDSFTFKIIRTFAFDLGLPLNANVELDADRLLSEAVDVVLSKIGDEPKLTQTLVDFSLEKLGDDKSWDISIDLKSFALRILNENDASNLKKLSNFSVDEFNNLKEKLLSELKNWENEIKNVGHEGLQIIANLPVSINDFYLEQIPKHFKNLATNYNNAGFFDQNTLKKNIEEQKFYAKSKPQNVKNAIESAMPKLLELYFISEEIYQKISLNKLILNSIIPLSVLNYIYKALEEIKIENNILLNAEFNQIISNSIKNEPAPFIYERIGEKFKYYFIDEMQDTSVLQWQNLIPLIENAVSTEMAPGDFGKLMLVGDAKQSIYRWRGGKAEQFIALSSAEKSKSSNPFFVEKSIENLETNYRSFSNIIDFNNNFFTHISSFLSNSNFKELFVTGNSQKPNNKEGGFVEVSFIDKKNTENDDESTDEAYPKKVLEIIKNIDPAFNKNEICVLVRTKSQGEAVANYLSEKGIEIISSETLLLSKNNKVNFLINLLNYIQNPANEKAKVQLLYFLHKHLHISLPKHQFLSTLLKLNFNEFFKSFSNFDIDFQVDKFAQHNLYNGVEYAIQQFKLVENSDAFVQFFLEFIFEYLQKKQTSLADFLTYWETKRDTVTIVVPEAENAVRIMTIHKAKGLEFPIVILPYDLKIYPQFNQKIWYNYTYENANWPFLVDFSKKLKNINQQGNRLYSQQKEEFELDNFNLLYVAYTRAEEQLYVIAEAKKDFKVNEPQSSSDLLFSYLQQSPNFDTKNLVFQLGNAKRVLVEQKNQIKQHQKQQNFISSARENHSITIVPSTSLFMKTERGEAVDFGNLFHEIVAQIKTADDIDSAIHKYLFFGKITHIEAEMLKTRLIQLVNHPKLYQYYLQNNTIITERELVTHNKQVLIPDRLIFENKNVTVIDYKTGKHNKTHYNQIEAYGDALQNLGYVIQKKILVYFNDEILVEEV